MTSFNVSAISVTSFIKISPENGNKRKGTSCEVNKSKKKQVLSLTVPNPLWEEKENAIPYFRCISNEKQRKRKRKIITVLTIPNVQESVEEENVQQETVSIPVVKRLNVEELKKVNCMKETVKKKRKSRKLRNANGLESQKQDE